MVVDSLSAIKNAQVRVIRNEDGLAVEDVAIASGLPAGVLGFEVAILYGEEGPDGEGSV